MPSQRRVPFRVLIGEQNRYEGGVADTTSVDQTPGRLS